MKLSFADGRFVAHTEYAERAVPKAARFRWDPQTKCWWTQDAANAAKLIQFADDDARERLGGVADQQAQAQAASRATDSDVDIPVPDGLSYLPFQRAGIAYSLGRQRTLIGDEMGLGKTIQAIGVANADETVRFVLVICPASLKLNWAREWTKWSTRPAAITVLGAKGKYDTSPADPEQHVVVINYDILAKHHDELRAKEWDLLVVDECHYLKNDKAKRTRHVLGHEHRNLDRQISPIAARRSVFLTGTPIVNRPIEIWPVAHHLAPEVFGNRFQFAKRYCDAHRTRWGWDFTGASHLDELQEILRSNFLVRRLKADVLTDLPAKRRQVIELPANGCSAVLKREQKSWAKVEANLTELRAAVAAADEHEDPEAHADAVRELKQGEQVAFQTMSLLRHETAVAKVPTVISHVEDAVEADGKVVVFAHHRDVIEQIAGYFGEHAVTIYGGVSIGDRQAAVDRFQSDPTCHVFVGQIQAAGVGITLTAASHVVFAELDWVPGNLTQAEDRCHRIGQTDSVLVQHLVLEGSLDATIAKRVISKQEVIDAALDVEHEPIARKAGPDFAVAEAILVAEREVAIEAAHVAAKVEREAKRQKQLAAAREQEARDYSWVTAELSGHVHRGLQILAGVCDGASTKDDAGFNGGDVYAGHRLARQTSLTPREAALGKALLVKYHRQLPEEINAAVRG